MRARVKECALCAVCLPVSMYAFAFVCVCAWLRVHVCVSFSACVCAAVVLGPQSDDPLSQPRGFVHLLACGL